jgi:proteasome lid subunit RPN8/RPN11
VIYFNRYSVAKYFFIRDNCNTEVLSGAKKAEFLECSLLGIGEKDQFHYITDMRIPKQECTAVTTDIDNHAHIQFRFDLEDKGLPAECGQLWFHTHPGSSANPSSTDVDTWKESYVNTDKPFGGMGIIAKSNGKNCTFARIMYDSIIGRQQQQCDMLYEAYPDKWVSLQYIFDVADTNDVYGVGDIHNTIFAEFKQHHKEWLAELKDNVKEEVKYATNHFLKGQFTNKHTQHHVGTGYSHITQQSGRQDASKKNLIGNQANHSTGVSSKTGPIRTISIEKLVALYTRNKKNSLNEFKKSEQKQILEHLNTDQESFELAHQRLKKNDAAYNVEDVMSWETETGPDGFSYPNLVDYTTMTNLAKSFNGDQYYDICSSVLIRPCRLVELVDEYIDYVKTGKKKSGHEQTK